MRMNAAMAGMLATVKLDDLRKAEVPAGFAAIAQGGWQVSGTGAYLLSTLAGAGTPGPFVDVVHEEYTVNGRGIADYDLPANGPERTPLLLRRCAAYAAMCLQSAETTIGDVGLTAYVSLSLGGLDDDLLTGYVTFCSERAGLPPYVADLDAVERTSILVITQAEAARLSSTWR